MTPLESRFRVLAGEFDHRAYLQGFPDSRRLCSYVNLAAAGSHVSWCSSAFVGPHRRGLASFGDHLSAFLVPFAGCLWVCSWSRVPGDRLVLSSHDSHSPRSHSPFGLSRPSDDSPFFGQPCCAYRPWFTCSSSCPRLHSGTSPGIGWTRSFFSPSTYACPAVLSDPSPRSSVRPKRSDFFFWFETRFQEVRFCQTTTATKAPRPQLSAAYPIHDGLTLRATPHSHPHSPSPHVLDTYRPCADPRTGTFPRTNTWATWAGALKARLPRTKTWPRAGDAALWMPLSNALPLSPRREMLPRWNLSRLFCPVTVRLTTRHRPLRSTPLCKFKWKT